MRAMKTPMYHAMYTNIVLFVVVALCLTSSGCTQPQSQAPPPTPTVQNINVNVQVPPTPVEDKIVDINVNGQHIHVETGANNKSVRIDESGKAPIDVNVVNGQMIT
jgi:hypothetical protein